MNGYFAAALATILITAGCASQPTAVAHEPVSAPVILNRPLTKPPPPLRVEATGRPPGPEYVWVSGHYEWNGRQYIWRAGRWVPKPYERAIYMEGYWEQRAGGWIWVPGTWR